MANGEFLVAVTNYFFDENNQGENPLQSAVNLLYMASHQDLDQTLSYKISENYAILRDSYISGSIGERNISYFQTRFDQPFTRGFNP